jgi:hypothetical protein
MLSHVNMSWYYKLKNLKYFMCKLKKVNKYLVQSLMTFYCVVSSIFLCKLLIFFKLHESETSEIFERLKALFYSAVDYVDSINGWELFTSTIGVLIVGTTILHFIQKKIVDRGESLCEEE